MCGVAGFQEPALIGRKDALVRYAESMGSRLRHRGPDAAGTWVDADSGVAMAHTRLSIIDLSSAGHQPMCSEDGRFVISYNGEIYNFREMRTELQGRGVGFRGNSDTEVLVQGLAIWGIERLLSKIVGMFAFAAWDRSERRFLLARDRVGIKPLYWTYRDGRFVFGSELKPLHSSPNWAPELDRDALASYFRYGYVPTPATIYRHVHKLEPGTLLIKDMDSAPKIICYWSLERIIEAAGNTTRHTSRSEAFEQLELLVRDAVDKRLVSDVPLGAFLSGGIDSSTVVSMMRDCGHSSIRTFSIGFSDPRFNEANHAKAVAHHLGTEHTEQYVEPEEAQGVIPELATIYDEPFADSSQIPTILISRLARKQVTVALSGDGGDELFGGYPRYQWAERIRRVVNVLPGPLETLFANMVRTASVGGWNRAARLSGVDRIIPHFGRRLHKLSDLSAYSTPDDMYDRLVSIWKDPRLLNSLGERRPNATVGGCIASKVPDFSARMRYVDTMTYLPDDILVKVDRASMSVGLEVRVPLLDHRIIEHVWSMPHETLAPKKRPKWALKRVLERHVPPRLTDRPKMGFGVPLGEWLRGPLREWTLDLLSDARLRREGVLNSLPVQEKLEEHMSGHSNWQEQLWTVLMFQAWKETWHPSCSFI